MNPYCIRSSWRVRRPPKSAAELGGNLTGSPETRVNCSEEQRSQLERCPTRNWVPGATPITRK
eukprot:4103423-Alexandrium_andersonii.AAC.1